MIMIPGNNPNLLPNASIHTLPVRHEHFVEDSAPDEPSPLLRLCGVLRRDHLHQPGEVFGEHLVNPLDDRLVEGGELGEVLLLELLSECLNVGEVCGWDAELGL